MRYFAPLILVLSFVTPAKAQLWAFASVDRLNRHLAGQVVDYTYNHGKDNRIFSNALQKPRDAYVYLPPNYDPNKRYPLLLYFHFVRVDEQEFIGSRQLIRLDRMIQAGEFPPTVVVCPDGTISGRNHITERTSFYVNGVKGRFEDHIITELIPFVMSRYSIRPEREAHAIMGISSGGFGALSLAIRYRSFFGAVATLAAPANLLYDTCHHNPLEDFQPETYRWKTCYDPNEIIGRFYLGLLRVKAKYFIEPVFGKPPEDVDARIAAVNPASLIESTNLQPGELAIYLNYAEWDGYNIDAQNKSFAWLASQRGVAVTLEEARHAGHNLRYFQSNHRPAFAWLQQHLLPPAP